MTQVYLFLFLSTVIACDIPDWFCSGATTKTFPIFLQILIKNLRPGENIPSSLTSKLYVFFSFINFCFKKSSQKVNVVA